MLVTVPADAALTPSHNHTAGQSLRH